MSGSLNYVLHQILWKHPYDEVRLKPHIEKVGCEWWVYPPSRTSPMGVWNLIPIAANQFSRACTIAAGMVRS